MKKPRILVTSAAGHTGTPAVYQLVEKGYPVRAFLHRDDIRAARFREAGAEVFIGNQLDMRASTVGPDGSKCRGAGSPQ